MNARHWTALILLVVGSLLAGCATPVITGTTTPSPRIVSVTGSATTYLAPDIAYLNIGVHTDMSTASAALSQNSAHTQQVIDAIKKLGVEAQDIRTSGFNIYPNTQYDPNTNKALPTTYVVDNTLFVTIHDLNKVGKLIDASVTAGANSINSIQFDVQDRSAAIKTARDAAVADARAQAGALAKAAGVALGDVQSIVDQSSSTVPVALSYGKASGYGGGAASVAAPIEAGQLTITATVYVTFAIR